MAQTQAFPEGTSGAHEREICREPLRTAEISSADQTACYAHRPGSEPALRKTRPTDQIPSEKSVTAIGLAPRQLRIRWHDASSGQPGRLPKPQVRMHSCRYAAQCPNFERYLDRNSVLPLKSQAGGRRSPARGPMLGSSPRRDRCGGDTPSEVVSCCRRLVDRRRLSGANYRRIAVLLATMAGHRSGCRDADRGRCRRDHSLAACMVVANRHSSRSRSCDSSRLGRSRQHGATSPRDCESYASGIARSRPQTGCPALCQRCESYG